MIASLVFLSGLSLVMATSTSQPGKCWLNSKAQAIGDPPTDKSYNQQYPYSRQAACFISLEAAPATTRATSIPIPKNSAALQIIP